MIIEEQGQEEPVSWRGIETVYEDPGYLKFSKATLMYGVVYEMTVTDQVTDPEDVTCWLHQIPQPYRLVDERETGRYAAVTGELTTSWLHLHDPSCLSSGCMRKAGGLRTP